ncbi:MAG TPA: YcnI family protein [Longimicrobium sp.]|nr:YcnI family protein [Longimicrobium sp.]
MRRISPGLRATLCSLAAVALLGVPSIALGHAVVYPKRAEPGAYERYLLRVPNERGVPTQRVEIRFPAGVKVVSFGDVPGWTLEVRKDAAGAVTGAAWTGTLPPERFVELPFVAVNPKEDARLVWPVTQTYANGERVDWNGPEGSKTPASSTQIAAADADAGSGRTGTWLGGAALVLSLVALGLALRKPAATGA